MSKEAIGAGWDELLSPKPLIWSGQSQLVKAEQSGWHWAGTNYSRQRGLSSRPSDSCCRIYCLNKHQKHPGGIFIPAWPSCRGRQDRLSGYRGREEINAFQTLTIGWLDMLHLFGTLVLLCTKLWRRPTGVNWAAILIKYHNIGHFHNVHMDWTRWRRRMVDNADKIIGKFLTSCTFYTI